MYNKTICSSLSGLTCTPVTVESDICDGMPVFDMVGYLGSEVKEARERVRTALKNSGVHLPAKRITVNLSPASIRKQGTAYDLATAISVMSCLLLIPQEALDDIMIIGELSLSGDVMGVTGILPRVMEARRLKLDRCMIPLANLAEASLVSDIEIIPVSSLRQAADILCKNIKYAPAAPASLSSMIQSQAVPGEDFSEINGQSLLRRALEVSAAGLHNVVMSGPPGSGKSMAAKRLPSILPPLSYDEILELTGIYSAAGKLPAGGVITTRPFVAPHHSSGAAALAGGGLIPRPGAISLAHRSILFLDELPEFSPQALESLRQPLEEHKVTLMRSAQSYTFPADFLLVGAMNPCKCGYYPDLSRCSCSPGAISRYLSRISGPIWDRIDIFTNAKELSFNEITYSNKNEPSCVIRSRVMAARERQAFRFRDSAISCNGRMNTGQINLHCRLGHKEMLLLEEAHKRMSLSARAFNKILKLSRTIADLDSSDDIKESHLCEAIGYMDRSSISPFRHS